MPRYMFRTAIDHAKQAVSHIIRGRAAEAFEHELWLAFFLGVLRQRWSDRQTPIGTAAVLRT